MIQFITTFHAMHLNVFLIVDQCAAYLVCYEHETSEFGYMCPCCMTKENKEAIMNAVKAAIHNGSITEKITWCSYKGYSPDLGNSINEDDLPLKQGYFVGGSAENISDETMSLLRLQALQLVSTGVIKSFRQK